MLNRYFNLILRRPYRVLLLVVMVVITLGAGVHKLSFTSDFRTYFSSENPQLQAFEAMEKRFSRQDNLFFLVSGNSQHLFTQKGLTLVETLTEKSWQLPYVQRVDSLQNFQYTEVEGDELIIDDLYRSDELTADMSALKHRALTHADIQLKLLSPDANVTGISLTLHLPEGSTSAASLEAVEAARTMLQPLRADFPEFMIELGGSATSNVTMGEAIGQDIRSLLLISYAVMLVIMLFMLRTVSGVILVSALIGMSVLITMGLYGWMGYTLTPPTGFVPTAIMTIAVADTVHILVSYYFFLRQGEERNQALLSSLKINFSPVFITSITTMVLSLIHI